MFESFVKSISYKTHQKFTDQMAMFESFVKSIWIYVNTSDTKS